MRDKLKCITQQEQRVEDKWRISKDVLLQTGRGKELERMIKLVTYYR